MAALSRANPNVSVASMRPLLAVLIAAACLAGSAKAEQRMFVIASNADGYGVDRCLESGAHCGAAAARAFCRTRQFVQAASFRKVDRDEITGSVPTEAASCHGANCDEFVAIVCSR
jgi:hypothetical protein